MPAPFDPETARVSVCMATFNGAAYVREQLASILAELSPGDEVIVVDDASSDDTVQIVRSLDDPRIALHARDENRGYVRTFEEALGRATGDILMLADQDDVWVPGRRAAMMAALADKGVVASNLVLLGSDAPLPSPVRRRPWRLHGDGGDRAGNELRILAGIAPYFGCAMALRRDFVDRVTPFPAYLTESHDLWIATVANRNRELRHLATATVRRRLHASNTSPSRPRGLRSVLAARVLLIRAWFDAARR